MLAACAGGRPAASVAVGPPSSSAAPTSGKTSEAVLGRLSWGRDAAGAPHTARSLQTALEREPQAELAMRTAGIIRAAQDTLGDSLKVVPEFQTEGILFSDPRYKQSIAASQQLSSLYAWAMCARVATAPLRDSCQARAADAVSTWVRTYTPTGNPINEAHLIPLFQAIDLVQPLLNADQRAADMKWLASVIRQNDAYYASVPSASATKVNNHATWGFSLRAIEAAVLGDAPLAASSRELLAQHLHRNIRPDGTTIDFAQRDALHYHQFDLQPLVQVLEYVPGAIDSDGEALILKALQFMEPYVSGRQEHIEFVNSTVAFDTERRNAGDPTFANAPWQLKNGGFMLLLARAHFPSIRPWTQAVVDASYSPRVRQLAALYTVP